MMPRWIWAISAVFSLTFSISELRSNPTVLLKVVEKKLVMNGKGASIFSIEQQNGTLGLSANKGGMFDVKLENRLQEPTSVHWHGLILPNAQDGVAFVTQYPICAIKTSFSLYNMDTYGP